MDLNLRERSVAADEPQSATMGQTSRRDARLTRVRLDAREQETGPPLATIQIGELTTRSAA
jgi:hypothetical protein